MLNVVSNFQRIFVRLFDCYYFIITFFFYDYVIIVPIFLFLPRVSGAVFTLRCAKANVVAAEKVSQKQMSLR